MSNNEVLGRSEQCGEVFGALAKVQAELAPIQCDSKNEEVGSLFASLSTLIEAARPILSKHGICYYSYYKMVSTESANYLIVTTTLGHSSGEWIECSCQLEVTDPLPWTTASLQSYGRRYTFAAVVGLSQADDDGVAAQNASRKCAESQSEEVKQRSKAYVDKAEEMFDAVEEAASEDIPFSPDGYKEWIEQLTKAANKGAKELSETFSSSDAAFTGFLLNHDSDTITGLKEVAAEADKSK